MTSFNTMTIKGILSENLLYYSVVKSTLALRSFPIVIYEFSFEASRLAQKFEILKFCIRVEYIFIKFDGLVCSR